MKTWSAVVLLASILLCCGFTALGVWQLQRLAWKRDLIARVDARVHAPPVPPPASRAWSRADEYRRVRVSGVFENDRETLVQAVTELGPGFWVMTPLKTAAGQEILVNRGFTPPDAVARSVHAAAAPTTEATVTGLLRLTEPHGGFLRANQPGPGRWYSRDVAAIARARGLENVAPYFIDAEASPNAAGWPHGGLTVVRFPNSHLAYALTWFSLAGMSVLWGAWPFIEAARSRRRRSGARLATGHGS